MLIAGVDEAGRGPWAGPVVAAAVILDINNVPEGIGDSKKLSASKRLDLFEKIKKSAIGYSIRLASVDEIDNLNILNATLLAMTRAVDGLHTRPRHCEPKARQSTLSLRAEGAAIQEINLDHHVSNAPRDNGCCDMTLQLSTQQFLSIRPDLVLVDGNICPKWPYKSEAIIKGDDKIVQISAASILAKVYRDLLMQQLHLECPDYGWDKNAGYGTKLHQEGLKNFGITKHHRKSFRPITNLINAG